MKVDIYDTENKYGIIYADPAWRYDDKSCSGNCADHYNTMSVEEICNLPVKNIADKDCILFMWVTYPMLQEGLDVMKAWGFTYKTIGFQWLKQNKTGNGYFFGLGRWTRGNTECCLIGTKGKPKRVSDRVSQLIISPIENHSKKPDCTRKKIEMLCGCLPRIELFARQTTDGWDCWGNEI